jgi:hypothetical protein
MAGSLEGPRDKIERAKKHVSELEVAVSGLVFSHTTHPHVILTENDPKSDNVLYKIATVPKVPGEIAAIAGDAIHNLRAPLDLLMTQLVERAGRMPKNRRTPYFPIGDDRKGFEARCDAKVEALVGKDALDCIRAAEPYRGGKGEAAWYLHDLDIEDKHRVKYGLGFNLSALTLPFPKVQFDDVDPKESAVFNEMTGKLMDTVFWRPGDGMFPLKDGDVLFSGPAEPTNDPKFRFDVAFAEPQIVHADPVLPALTQYGQAVEGLVESFAPLF